MSRDASRPEALDVTITHHGPIVNEALGADDEQPLALVVDGASVSAAHRGVDARLPRARTGEELLEATSEHTAPPLNMLWADSQRQHRLPADRQAAGPHIPADPRPRRPSTSSGTPPVGRRIWRAPPVHASHATSCTQHASSTPDPPNNAEVDHPTGRDRGLHFDQPSSRLTPDNQARWQRPRWVTASAAAEAIIASMHEGGRTMKVDAP